MNGKKLVLVLVYIACFCVALLVPWWLALAFLITPMFFNGLYGLGIVFGLILDLVYGYHLAGFPYHTFRYTLAILLGALVIFLLKKVIRI